MFNFMNIIRGTNISLTPKQVAKLLKTTPEALQAFENSYRVHALEQPDASDPFATSVQQANENIKADATTTAYDYDVKALNDICERIVVELLNKTRVWDFDGKTGRLLNERTAFSIPVEPVTNEELKQFPEAIRPMLTGDLAMVDMPHSTGPSLLWMYKKFLEEKGPKKKAMFYHHFRQGLDILDLDPLSYAMLGMNQNAMSHWLPAVAETAVEQGFFKVPATTVIQVPLTLLQLTRLDYERLNGTTRRIINEFCMRAFNLDIQKDYFVKTGTYSSKFDFRNAHVTAGKEVTELGEYLTYISNRAVHMAGPLMSTSIYGMSTTNEWAVREYIPDVSDEKLTIYKGMPLRTEYRLFVDFDKGEVIGANPYWDAKLMEKRFAEGAVQGNDHDKHDYIIYLAAKDELYHQYEKNIARVTDAVRALTQAVRDARTLTGQWSVDVMQNGDDFYLIDMAWAQQSALYDCVPEEKRLPMQENWLPAIGD